MYIRVPAALRLIGNVKIWSLSPEEVSGGTLDPLALSLDPLGKVRRSCELLCKYVCKLSNQFGPRNQSSEYVDKPTCTTFT